MKNFPTNNTAWMRGHWAITKPGMMALLDSIQFAQHQMQQDSSFDFDDFFTPRESLYIDKYGIAHINIKGALMDQAPKIYEKLGGTDYRTLRSEIAQAQDALGIILRVDSPGGTVAGLEEASTAIANSDVPVAVYVDGMCCSAAYHLASSAKVIAASPSSDVGNIGTVLAWLDDAQFLESMGFETNVITNEGADLKGTFRDSPMTDAQREFLQDETNRIGEEFHDHVLENRPFVDDEVFRAGWYHGVRAGELGLIDATGYYDEVVSAMATAIAAS